MNRSFAAAAAAGSRTTGGVDRNVFRGAALGNELKPVNVNGELDYVLRLDTRDHY